MAGGGEWLNPAPHLGGHFAVQVLQLEVGGADCSDFPRDVQIELAACSVVRHGGR